MLDAEQQQTIVTRLNRVEGQIRGIRRMVQEFMDTEVAPIAAEVDRTGAFPTRTVARMGELGLMGINVPQEYGGAGADTVSFALVAEELTRVCATHAVIYGANNTLTCNPINNFGTDEQKSEHLVPLATGKAFGAYALTEPGAGSDAAGLVTRAEKDGDDYVLNGTKVFISNGSIADTMIVFARTGGPGPKGVSAFIVPPKRTEGVTAGPNEKKLGLRASPTNQIFFKDAGRAFCLYVVLGAGGRAARLVPRVNQVLAELRIDPR
jgi:butyryl-CoA dehydrogenase